MKKRNLLIIIVLYLCLPILVLAKDYNIDSYDINIKVEDNGKYYYTETINVTFENKNVLITKEMPKDIQDLEVSTNYIIGARNTKTIKINSGNNKTGTYTYKYLYEDLISQKDIYEIEIKNNFNEEINNSTFNVDLPEEINKNNLSFYINDKKISNIKYKINQNKVTFHYENLKKNDVISLKVNYGKLYFSTYTITAILIPILFSLFSLFIWYAYGKDLKYKVQKTPNISRKYNPLDVALIYKGEINKEDVLLTILHLANKGYIKITERTKNEFIIEKVKEYDGKNYKESTLLKSLFRKNTVTSLADYINIVSEKKNNNKNSYEKKISSDMLKECFNRTSNYILNIVNNEDEKNKYFDNKSENKKNYLLFMVTTILILVTSIPFIEINKLYYLPLSVLFSIFTLYILLKFVNNIDFKNKKQKLYFLIALAAITLIIMLLPTFRRNRVYILAFFIGCISVAFIMFLFKYMPKRTVHGTKQYAKIEGVKLFLNELNNKELDNVLELNENYLYDILPYSYIIESNHVVMKKLKEYNVKEPTWYDLNEEYSVQKFNNSLKRLRNILIKKDEE